MAIDSSNISFGMGSAAGADSIGTIPLRLLVVADLSREDRGMGDTAPARTFRVDKDTFDELFPKLNPRLVFEVKNLVAGGNEPIVVDLEFSSMKDFEGPAIVAKIPALTALQQLRDEIARAASPDDTPSSLAEKISNLGILAPVTRDLISAVLSQPDSAPPKSFPSPAAPAPAASSGSAVDSILDMMEEGSAGGPPPPSSAEHALSSAMSSMFKSSKSSAPSKTTKNAISAAHAWIDQRIGSQLDAILHHPDFLSMEEAWRGLRFLVERTDFRKEIVLEVLAARKQDLRRILIEQVLQEEYDNPGDPPLAAVICDIPFDNGTPDIDLLNELAAKGELIQAPIIAQAAPEFFGRKTLQGLGGTGSLFAVFQGEAYTKWRALRAKEEARWIALATNRFLLRQPYKGGDGKSFPETAVETKGEGLLWGNTVWGLASCMTRSFARENWAHTLSGPRGGGAVENLPLRNIEQRGGKITPTPVEAAFQESQVQDLASGGLIPLLADEGSDAAYFTFLPCVFTPKKFSDPRATQEAALHSILPYQLFAARISHWLARLLPKLRGGFSAEELQEALQKSLASVLTGPGQPAGASKVRVEVSDHDKDPMRYQVCFEIHPAFKFFGMTPRLLLAVAVPR